MTAQFPRYAALQSTGLPWVPLIPKHWHIRRNGGLFSQRVETGFPELPILEVSLRTGVRVRDMENIQRKQVMGQREKYKRAAKGDIAYNMMRMWQGALGVAPVDGLISPAYVVARPYEGVNSAYYSYLYRIDAYLREVNKFSRGIVSDRNRLYWVGFKQMPALLPPVEEQDQIVAYLRAQDAKIARFIRDKRRLIELLNEQKQMLIHRAVTRGLDPNVRLKPSGVESLGNVPVHWVCKPLKHWARINECSLPESTEDDYRFHYVDIGTVKTGRLARDPTVLDFKAAPSRARRILRRGDTIISTVRTYLRAVWTASHDVSDWVASTGFAVLTPRAGVDPIFLGYVVQGDDFINRVAANSVGIAYPAIPETVLGRFHIALPPTVEEQQTLVRQITQDSAPIDTGIAQAAEEIRLMREYRDRLVADVGAGARRRYRRGHRSLG
jgi:type I restriction enzyme S subunit